MMSKPDRIPYGSLIDTTRALLRGTLQRCLGDDGLMTIHRFYHAILRRFGHFDPPESAETLWLLAGLTVKANTILDIGANAGRYSWFCIRHRRAGTPLYAFEPNPAAVALLRRLLRDQPATHLLPVALGDADGSVGLMVPTDRFGNAISGLGWVYPVNGNGGPISVHRLDGLVETGIVRLASPLLMKIDVEGYEPAVLAGSAQTLERHRPVIYFECDPATLTRAALARDAAFVRLAALGYSILTEQNGRFVLCAAPASTSRNYIAIPFPPGKIGPMLTATDVMAVVEAALAASSVEHGGSPP